MSRPRRVGWILPSAISALIIAVVAYNTFATLGYNTNQILRAANLSGESRPLPNITLIATGGTIAGATNFTARKTLTTFYETSVLGVDEITRGLHEEWKGDAVVYFDQLMSMDSVNMNSSHGIMLSQRVTIVVNNPHTQGIVLTHGTDLMSEMAMFLALTVASSKPIVMTGAIWPHTALGADGPGNILAAVKTAATTAWRPEGLGVVIAIQDKIMGPWGTRKENNRFVPGAGSLLGEIRDFAPFFRGLPGSCVPAMFDITELSPETPLPEVVIFQAHQDFPAYLVEAAIDRGARGIVLVSYGDGYWPETSGRKIKKLVEESKVVVVFATENYSGYVATARMGVGIPGGDWAPRQLRILLQLLLWDGANEDRIRRVVRDLPKSCHCHCPGVPADTFLNDLG